LGRLLLRVGRGIAKRAVLRGNARGPGKLRRLQTLRRKRALTRKKGLQRRRERPGRQLETDLHDDPIVGLECGDQRRLFPVGPFLLGLPLPILLCLPVGGGAALRARAAARTRTRARAGAPAELLENRILLLGSQVAKHIDLI
jgi:hypothetical protein